MSTIDPSTGRRYPAEPGPAYNDAKVADGPSAIVDAPKRDRFVWGGDLAVANPVAYLTTGDTVSPQASFEWLAKKPSAAGQPAGVYLPLPGDAGWNYSWGEYAAWWIVNYETHYRYTGDRAFLDRWFSQLQGAVSWFESHVGADGLVDVPGDAGGHWGYGHSGKESYDNALYVHALAFAARAAEAENRPDLATAWRALATRTAKAINDALWDGTAYVVGPDDARHAQDGNAMALLAGVATGDRADAVRRFLAGLNGPFGPLTVDAPGGAVPQYVSPFITAFQLETADTDAAIGLLRRTWSPMLRGDTTGTFLENVSTAGGPQLGSYTSYSHGWAAAPTSYLTTKVLGVEPEGAGFSSFTVTPRPGSLQWAEGAVPTPHGTIGVAFKRTGGRLQLHVEAPPGTTYRATLPDGTTRTNLTGTTDLEAGR
jgi:alpha-L-rhamnosidase-like protein